MRSKKEQYQERAAILVLIDRIVEGYPDVPIAQHLRTILRSKGKEDPYSWTNTVLLSKLEKYQTELEDNPPHLWED